MPIPLNGALRAACILFGLVLTPLVAAGTARAQSAPIEGTFRYVAAESDDIAEAIDEVVDEMNFLIRGFARGRLENTNAPYQTVTITPGETEIAVATDGRDPITAPASGDPIDWTREDGEEMKVSLTWDGGALRQTFIAEDGQRENVYRLSPDGETLSMTVTVTSERLPRPLTYTLVYKRES